MNRAVSIPTMKGIRIALSCLLLAGFSLGQGGVATGDLHVSVKDPSGNAVVNATVTVRDLAKGLERVATSALIAAASNFAFVDRALAQTTLAPDAALKRLMDGNRRYAEG